MLELVLPNKKYAESVKMAAEEYKQTPSRFDIGEVKRMVAALDGNFLTHLEAYIKKSEKDRNAENLEEGKVPATTLWLIKDGKYIGMYNVRHYLNEFLEQRGGHIGYEIIPSERGKGYVKAGLRLALRYCREVLELKKVLLTCNFKNEASYKAMSNVMQEYGGYEQEPTVFEGEQMHRVWILTSKEE